MVVAVVLTGDFDRLEIPPGQLRAVCMPVERDHALAGATDGVRRFGRIFQALSTGLDRV